MIEFLTSLKEIFIGLFVVLGSFFVTEVPEPIGAVPNIKSAIEIQQDNYFDLNRIYEQVFLKKVGNNIEYYVHSYEGPSGVGYQLVVTVKTPTKETIRSFGYGPEGTHRTWSYESIIESAIASST